MKVLWETLQHNAVRVVLVVAMVRPGTARGSSVAGRHKFPAPIPTRRRCPVAPHRLGRGAWRFSSPCSSRTCGRSPTRARS